MATDDATGQEAGSPTCRTRGGDDGPRSANVYLLQLCITVRAELDAIPGPLDQSDTEIVAAFHRFLDLVHNVHPHMAFRLLQVMRLVIQQLATGEAPPGPDQPSPVPG